MVSKEVLWDSEKNVIKESELTFGSERKIWWLCEKSHSWQAAYRNIKTLGRGCPYCAGRKVLIGYNNIFYTHPEIEKLWDFNKNSVDPASITAGSHKKVWWICSLGHSWEAIIKSVANGCRCPICSNRKVLQGFNDFVSQEPELLKEWDYEKNIIDPKNMSIGSNEKVWWVCSKNKNHKWQTTLKSRTNDKQRTGCPYCSNIPKRISYEKSFAYLHPDLVKEVHPIKNPDLIVEELFEFSPKRIWWQCKLEHEWEAIVYSRTSGKTGCPYCAGKNVLIGFNDLKTTRPDLVKLWHPSKNGDLVPEMFSAGSDRKIWWLCESGHSTITTISSRAAGYSCRKCSNIVSKKELELLKFVEGFLKNNFVDCQVKTNVRNVISPYELDIYISDLRIAFEFNGVYWHDKDLWEKDVKNGTSFSKEMLKTNLCNDLGIELFHVWEDDWDTNPDFVKSFIKDALSKAKATIS